jgi:hypothetical protein
MSSLDWVRDPFVLNAFEPAEFTVAKEDELAEIRNNRKLRLKLKHSSTYVYGLTFVVSQTRVPHHHE